MTIATSIPGAGVAYRECGDGPQAVILVHGWLASGRVWDDLLDELDLDGLRVVVPDLRGTGASPKPAGGYTLDAFADDVEDVVRRARLDDYVLVGHSMGAQVAQLVAARRPARARGLVLICPVPLTGLPVPADAAGLMRGCGGDRDAQHTIHAMASRRLSADAHERMLDDGEGIPAVAIAEGFDAWSRGADGVGAVVAPTLVLAGDDPVIPVEVLRDHVLASLPRARLARLPEAGHYPHVEAPAQTAAVIQGYLAAAPTSSPSPP
jgi:non-heme chloroperoxidase